MHLPLEILFLLLSLPGIERILIMPVTALWWDVHACKRTIQALASPLWSSMKQGV